jgi:hypothetical protein
MNYLTIIHQFIQMGIHIAKYEDSNEEISP